MNHFLVTRHDAMATNRVEPSKGAIRPFDRFQFVQ